MLLNMWLSLTSAEFVFFIVTINDKVLFGLPYEETLQLVHVVFRHGDKTTDPTYPKDPYINETYEPYGVGELTDKGKQRMFLLGKALHERYNNFLGSVSSPGVLEALSTQLNRSKMSLDLVLTGLYAPKGAVLELEKNLNWQMISYDSLLFEDDHLMSPPAFFCTVYGEHYRDFLKTPGGSQIQQKYEELFRYLSRNTGWNIRTPSNVSRIYDLLVTTEDWGLQLPEWTSEIYPERLREAVIDANIISLATSRLIQLSGFLLKKIMQDTQSKIEQLIIPPNRKMFLYSGHDYNIVSLLGGMEVFYPHIPPYGACVLIELHKIDDEYGFRIFYHEHGEFNPRALKIPGCGRFCPFERFLKLLGRALPTDDRMCDVY